ncbi:MAG TPA: aminomethyltransferase family protein [Tissierellaceae bacterium]|nr:aminomethyltransferase family protein [Tissierellaceae bacterium]
MLKNDQVRRKDHETIRKHVGFYDFTHEVLEVGGKDATKFLDYIFLNSIHNTKLDGAKYTTMLNEDGIIIDDVIVFRLEEDLYWVSTLFIKEMKEWFEKYKEGFDFQYKDITEEISMWAVQGPDSRKLLNKILEENIDDMKFFDFKENKVDNIPVRISRSGFTGELGYEIYANPRCEDILRKELLEKGKEFNVKEMETDVILTSIPAEKGYVIMSDLEGLNPYEAGFAWSIRWNKDFIGKEALEKVKDDNPKQRLLGYITDEDVDIEEKSIIKVDDKEVGKVTKSAYGYTVEKNIGYVVLDKEYANKDQEIEIVNGDDVVKAVVTDRVFYDKDDERRYGR